MPFWRNFDSEYKKAPACSIFLCNTIKRNGQRPHLYLVHWVIKNLFRVQRTKFLNPKRRFSTESKGAPRKTFWNDRIYTRTEGESTHQMLFWSCVFWPTRALLVPRTPKSTTPFYTDSVYLSDSPSPVAKWVALPARLEWSFPGTKYHRARLVPAAIV